MGNRVHSIEATMEELSERSSEPLRLSATELRKLSASERSAILAAQAAMAEGLYRLGGDLTGFEAFGEDDLHGDGAVTEAG